MMMLLLLMMMMMMMIHTKIFHYGVWRDLHHKGGMN